MTTRSRTIWCIGLYASASTWTFNALRLLHAKAAPPLVLRSYFASGQLDLTAFAEPLTHLVKSHEITHPGTLAELARRADKIIVTVRDPRDAIASLLLYHKLDFSAALDLVDQTMRLCARFAADPRAKLYYYETRFFEQPETVPALAAHLGLNTPATACGEIFASLGREAVEQHIARLPTLPGILQDIKSGDRLDPQTHWHTHHAGRTGEIGRWRHQLSPIQARAVEDRLRDCFRFHKESVS